MSTSDGGRPRRIARVRRSVEYGISSCGSVRSMKLRMPARRRESSLSMDLVIVGEKGYSQATVQYIALYGQSVRVEWKEQYARRCGVAQYEFTIGLGGTIIRRELDFHFAGLVWKASMFMVFDCSRMAVTEGFDERESLGRMVAIGEGCAGFYNREVIAEVKENTSRIQTPIDRTRKQSFHFKYCPPRFWVRHPPKNHSV